MLYLVSIGFCAQNSNLSAVKKIRAAGLRGSIFGVARMYASATKLGSGAPLLVVWGVFAPDMNTPTAILQKGMHR